MKGGGVTRLIDTANASEIAVVGAVWIDAPRSRYVDAVNDIERFESGGAFKMTRRISATPTLQDFAELRLPDKDLEDLRTCRVGGCKIKLGETSIRKLQTDVNWSAPTALADANSLMQRMAFEYVAGYAEGGNGRLAVYRDSSRPTVVANEFHAIANRLPSLSARMDGIRAYLLDYPKASLPDATSFLYWQEATFGLKPTIRISHLTIRDGPEETIVASKMLYATHYFRSALELRALIPDPSRGDGFWLLTVNRSRADGLDGAGVIRRRVQRQVEESMTAGLNAIKQRFGG